MERLHIRLDLPRDLLSVLDVLETEVEPELKRLIALEIFRQDRISSGKAAELLDISKGAFAGLLARHGIPCFTETPEELDSQVAAVGRLLDASEES